MIRFSREKTRKITPGVFHPVGALLFLAFVFRSGLVREDDELNEAFESEAELLNLRGRKCNFPSAANDGHLSSIHPLVYKIIFW